MEAHHLERKGLQMKSHVFALRSVLCGALAVSTVTGAARADDRDCGGSCGAAGTSRVLATMPVTSTGYQPTGPTYPEGTAVVGGRVIVSGPANFGTAGNGSPSQLTIFDRHSGALRMQVPVVGEDLSAEHALSELASWGDYVYAPSTQLGVLRWRIQGNGQTPAQERVSTPFCSATGASPCHVDTTRCPADVRPGLPPLPNGITVDSHGTSYVTDALQGIVWRISARDDGAPSTPEVFACSRALQGSGTEGLSLFGANGIAEHDGSLYVSVTFGPMEATGPSSVIYRIRKRAPATLEPVFTYHPVQVAPGVMVPPIADGVRIHPRSGHLFVVLGGQNQLSELDISRSPAVEVGRFSRTDSDHPFSNPSTVAFSPDGDSAYVSNHAIMCCLAGDPNPACVCSGAQNLFGVIELCVR